MWKYLQAHVMESILHSVYLCSTGVRAQLAKWITRPSWVSNTEMPTGLPSVYIFVCWCLSRPMDILSSRQSIFYDVASKPRVLLILLIVEVHVTSWE